MLNLVDYSSSDSEDEAICEAAKNHPPEAQEAQPANSKQVKRLPMPFKLQKQSEDKPEEHQMRLRSFEGSRGTWASHVFIDCEYFRSLIKLIYSNSH